MKWGEQTIVGASHIEWGTLFGYSSEAIQQFIDKEEKSGG